MSTLDKKKIMWVENNNLKNQLQESVKKIDKDSKSVEKYDKRYENLSNIKKRLKKVLLENPKIDFISKNDIDSKNGKHQSKDFVKDIADIFEKTKEIEKYVKGIKSCEYNPHKRGTIILSKDKFENYNAHIYDDHDQGYGAMVELSSKNLHDSVSLLKYIINTINQFKKYDLEVKEN